MTCRREVPMSVHTLLAAFFVALPAATAARAAEASDPAGSLGLGLQFGTALVILLAVLIAVSVAAKLLIVFGAVPRRPETGFHALVHAMANFVGSLTKPRQRRRDTVGRDDR